MDDGYRIDGMRTAHTVLVGKPERKKTVGRPRCKWRDNIEIDIR
jgi:hypothetical protein